MRLHLESLQLGDELASVVALVRAQADLGLRVGLSGIGDHGLGGFALGMAVGLGDPGVDDQAMAVVHQRVADEAQLAGRVALAVEPAVGIGLGGMGGIAARLAPEVTAIGAAVGTPMGGAEGTWPTAGGVATAAVTALDTLGLATATAAFVAIPIILGKEEPNVLQTTAS